jgi:hypothetical protein
MDTCRITDIDVNRGVLTIVGITDDDRHVELILDTEDMPASTLAQATASLADATAEKVRRVERASKL